MFIKLWCNIHQDRIKFFEQWTFLNETNFIYRNYHSTPAGDKSQSLTCTQYYHFLSSFDMLILNILYKYICIEKKFLIKGLQGIGRKACYLAQWFINLFSYSYPCIPKNCICVPFILWPCIPEMQFCAVLRTSRGRIWVYKLANSTELWFGPQGCQSVNIRDTTKRCLPISLVGPFLGPQPW